MGQVDAGLDQGHAAGKVANSCIYGAKPVAGVEVCSASGDRAIGRLCATTPRPGSWHAWQAGQDLAVSASE